MNTAKERQSDMLAQQTETFRVTSRDGRHRSATPVLDREYRAYALDPSPLDDLASDMETDTDASGWQPIVGTCRDGRLIGGYTKDFNARKPYLHVSPTPHAEREQFVSMIHLDALFFLDDVPAAITGDAESAGGHEAAADRRTVAMTLPNGQELIGTTLSYRSDGSGFFVHPIDDESSTLRVFVTQSGIRNIRFL